MDDMNVAGLRVHARRKDTVGETPTSAIVLLHGFGAPGNDLISMAEHIEAPPGTIFLFPEGPLALSPESRDHSAARAWWPIDTLAFQAAMMTGRLDSAAEQLGFGLDAACGQVVQLLNAIQSEFSIEPERIVLGGFSQGAIASLHVSLLDTRPLAGLILMSATIVGRDRLMALAPRREKMPAMLSHGYGDLVLPFSLAESLKELLLNANWEVTWLPFQGGHGVPPRVMHMASKLVGEWIG